MLKTDKDFEDKLPPVKLRDKRTDPVQPPRPRQDDNFDSLLRLLIGAMVEGKIELDQRLQLWEQQVGRELDEAADNPMERLRHTLIGLMFEGRDFVENRLRQIEDRTQTTQSTLRGWLAPVLNNPLMRRVQAEVEKHVHTVTEYTDRLAQRGQLEENRGRQIATHAYNDIIDDFLNYLSRNPEVNEMIRKQSADLASSVLSNAREVSISADDKVEAIARAILGRRPRRDLNEQDQRVTYILRE